MSSPRETEKGRRAFILQTSAISAGALLALPRTAVADPKPETTRSASFARPPSVLHPNTW